MIVSNKSNVAVANQHLITNSFDVGESLTACDGKKYHTFKVRHLDR